MDYSSLKMGLESSIHQPWKEQYSFPSSKNSGWDRVWGDELRVSLDNLKPLAIALSMDGVYICTIWWSGNLQGEMNINTVQGS